MKLIRHQEIFLLCTELVSSIMTCKVEKDVTCPLSVCSCCSPAPADLLAGPAERFVITCSCLQIFSSFLPSELTDPLPLLTLCK